jgi:hypothetical protein
MRGDHLHRACRIGLDHCARLRVRGERRIRKGEAIDGVAALAHSAREQVVQSNVSNAHGRKRTMLATNAT